MNRKTVIILGVILFLTLSILCLLTHARKIENRLTALCTEALNAAGIEGASVSFDGRTAILAGTVASQEMLDKAKALIESINGVRSVSNGLTVATPLEEIGDQKETADEKSEEVKIDLSSLVAGLNVRFATNRSEPLEGSGHVLGQVTALLKEHTQPRVEIAGHADSRGTLKHNQGLSLRRAQSVRNLLIQQGVSAEKLSAKGYGETKPIADNSTTEGMEKNRRVEFMVIKED